MFTELPRRNPLILRWLFPVAIILMVAGCFQPAGSSLEPTSADVADLTMIATLTSASPTPFVTPLPPEGFAPPTETPIVLPTQPPPTNPPTVLPTDAPTQPAASPTAFQMFEQPTAVPELTLEPTPTIFLPPTPTALPPDEPCTHTVQPGEWMLKIARQYNLTLEQLLAVNPQFRGREGSLQPGDVLTIPGCVKPAAQQPPQDLPPQAVQNPPAQPTANQGGLPTPIPLTDRVYIVVAGDTLGAIARKFGVTVQALKNVNGIGEGDFIREGQQLKIPEPGN